VECGCWVMAVGTCSDALAVDAMYATVTGRGYHAADLVAARTAWPVPAGFPPLVAHAAPLPWRWYDALPVNTVDVAADVHPGGVVHVLRPLAEVEAKEVALAAHALALPQPVTSDATTMAAPRDSLHVGVRDLIATLQSSFGSTAHNVVRTVTKAHHPARDGSATHDNRCSGCGGRLPSLGTAYAGAVAETARLVGMPVRPPWLAAALCHGCMTAARERRPAPLPAAPTRPLPVAHAVRDFLDRAPTHTVAGLAVATVSGVAVGCHPPATGTSRAAMRAAIAEYLLDESDCEA